jgi:N-methylhydantoinase A
MEEENRTLSLRIGVDIGGTFTDFVIYHPQIGRIETFKVLSTPSDPAEAVLKGLAALENRIRLNSGVSIIHGSTVATNALLERKGARTALVTTRGFRDVLQIGRQNRPALYDFNADPPEPLVPVNWRLEVNERVDHNGRVLHSLNLSTVEDLISILDSSDIESVAVCLLFSFLHPEHEELIAEKLRSAGYFVSASHEILPEYREYERTSTTVVNAYVSPVMDRYLTHLKNALTAGNDSPHLRVMQSNGGVISLEDARKNGVRCILSGPAGGLVGARYYGALAQPGLEQHTSESDISGIRLITFDMGGTSTDVSLIETEPHLTSESVVGGFPIRVPVLDIHTIGAGGGSIASVDLGGALRVGPQSAGADPGPACYGRGDLPTVTDANLVLGRLAPEFFLGGQMHLDLQRAINSLNRLGEELGFGSDGAVQAALGVVEIANAHMERALRVISVERGHDPRDFTLLSFGGAGGLHASDLARRLGIPFVLVPPLASTLSAFGMLAADVVKDYSQTVMFSGDTPFSKLTEAISPLVERGLQQVEEEGIAPEDIHVERLLDLRYRGQSYELTVPFSEGISAGFHEIHRQTYGYARPDAEIEIVNLRVRAAGKVDSPKLSPLPLGDSDPKPALHDIRPVVGGDGKSHPIPFYQGELLQPGNRISGPAVIFRSDTTILIGPTDLVSVDAYQNVLIQV